MKDSIYDMDLTELRAHREEVLALPSDGSWERTTYIASLSRQEESLLHTKHGPASCTTKVAQWDMAGNTYGVLTLEQDNEGDFFFKMGDCMGDDYSHALTAKQIAAFNLLKEID